MRALGVVLSTSTDRGAASSLAVWPLSPAWSAAEERRPPGRSHRYPQGGRPGSPGHSPRRTSASEQCPGPRPTGALGRLSSPAARDGPGRRNSVVRHREDRIIERPPAPLLRRVVPAHRAHAVQVLTVDRDDELRKVLLLVDRVNVRRQAVQEGARTWKPGRSSRWASGAAAGGATTCGGERPQPRKVHLVGRHLARACLRVAPPGRARCARTASK